MTNPTPARSPIRFTADSPDISPPGMPRAYYAVSGSIDGVQVHDLSILDTGDFTTVNDAIRLPYQGTNILRYTPTTLDWARTDAGSVDILSDQTLTCTYMVFAAVRTASGVDWLMRPIVGGVVGRVSVIDGSTSNVQVVPLGTVSANVLQGDPDFALDVRATTLSGGPTLDMSWYAIVNLTRPNTYVWYQPIPSLSTQTHGAAHYEVLDDRQSLAGRQTALDAIYDDRQGDVDLTMGATTLYALALPIMDSLDWVAPAGGGDKATYTYSVTRRAAYRSPQ